MDPVSAGIEVFSLIFGAAQKLVPVALDYVHNRNATLEQMKTLAYTAMDALFDEVSKVRGKVQADDTVALTEAMEGLKQR